MTSLSFLIQHFSLDGGKKDEQKRKITHTFEFKIDDKGQ